MKNYLPRQFESFFHPVSNIRIVRYIFRNRPVRKLIRIKFIRL